jgi:uncharacterized lipoprotein YajG
MPCTLCGSDFHDRSKCPLEKAIMKKTLVALAALALLSGCAGLSINFDAAVTYRSDVPIGERKQ